VTTHAVDVDAHHGNGTQAIFYARDDVLYALVHVDPGAGWFPHFAGFADEQGTGAGVGANVNAPVAPGTGDEGWPREVARLRDAVGAWSPDAVVVHEGGYHLPTLGELTVAALDGLQNG
jgi:acetoin utilization deacetylase AcuC-like enzyme